LCNNLEHRWTKIEEITNEAKEPVAQITAVGVAERIEKSECQHLLRQVTFDYLVEQSDDQAMYHTPYWGVLEYTMQDQYLQIYYRVPQQSINDAIFELHWRKTRNEHKL